MIIVCLTLIGIWLSSLSDSPIIWMENFGCAETFCDQGKRRRSTRWVQSRSRGTRTILYTQWGNECQRERAPALGEKAFWCCVSDKVEKDAAGIGRLNDRMKAFSKEAEGRPNGAVEPRERWSGKISNSESKYWEVSAQSVQLVRKGWFSVQRFNSENQIAILWRNSSILNEESRTTKVNLRTAEQRNR